MIKLLLFFSVLIFSKNICAQSFIVSNFQEHPTDMEARINGLRDVNDVLCALVKIRTNLSEVVLYGNRGIEKEQVKVGEIWVWVQEGTRQLKFRKNGYPMVPYYFPDGLKSAVVYSLDLESDPPIVVNKAKHDTSISAEKEPFTIDNIKPSIQIISPDITRGFKSVEQSKKIKIQGKATDASGIFEVMVNGKEAFVDGEGNFSQIILLAYGNNTISVKATDVNNNSSLKTFTIERKSAQQEEILLESEKPITQSISKGKYFALIIGVQDYRDPQITDLDQPVSDAQKLYDVLVKEYTFSNENIKLLKNPTRNDITKALDFYYDNTTEEDNLLIFYAGHGYWDEKFEQGYWLTADAYKNNRGSWLSNSTIRDYMRAIPTKHTLLVTDACFGGGIFKSRDAFTNASVAINQLYELPSRKAMTSGALKEVPDKSVFIEYLVKRLEQNTDKHLSSEQLFSKFKIAVINNSANGQVPQFGEVKETGDEGGDFIFIKK